MEERKCSVWLHRIIQSVFTYDRHILIGCKTHARDSASPMDETESEARAGRNTATLICIENYVWPQNYTQTLQILPHTFTPWHESMAALCMSHWLARHKRSAERYRRTDVSTRRCNNSQFGTCSLLDMGKVSRVCSIRVFFIDKGRISFWPQ